MNMRLSDLVLVAVTLIWGVTFSLTKHGVSFVSPLLFLALRFLLAFGLLVGAGLPRLRALTRIELYAGVATGLVYAAGFIAQTMGLRTTTAAKAAFITGLNVVLVPLFSTVILRLRPERTEIAGSLLSFLGLAVLSVNRSLLLLSLGDFLVLLCAVFFALHIILMGRWATEVDPWRFTTVQVGVTGALCAALMLPLEPFPSHIPLSVWASLAFLAVFATIGTTVMQAWAQRHTDPTRTAIIFTLEPVFAAVFAFFLLGEVQSLRTWAGGALIIAGILTAELSRTRGSCSGKPWCGRSGGWRRAGRECSPRRSAPRP
ncbi:MAG: DMT family transporter [Bacillota bacterium]|nr:DMT family transporter [Bacillota bacterium]